LLCSGTKSVAQNIRGFIKRLPRAAQTKGVWESHAVLKTVFVNHCSGATFTVYILI